MIYETIHILAVKRKKNSGRGRMEIIIKRNGRQDELVQALEHDIFSAFRIRTYSSLLYRGYLRCSPCT